MSPTKTSIAISCGPKRTNRWATCSGGAQSDDGPGAWPHFQQALDWWAGQRDLERARARYLAIVFKARSPPFATTYYVYTYYGNIIPLDILENALKISTSANDRSHLNFLIAMNMRYTGGGDIGRRQRVPDYFEEALKAGKQSDWYDDALFHYAEWMNNFGTMRDSQMGSGNSNPIMRKRWNSIAG